MRLKKRHKLGLIFGVTIYVGMVFVFPYLNKEEITITKSIISLPFWIFAGLLFGYAQRNNLDKKKKT